MLSPLSKWYVHDLEEFNETQTSLWEWIYYRVSVFAVHSIILYKQHSIREAKSNEDSKRWRRGKKGLGGLSIADRTTKRMICGKMRQIITDQLYW